MIGCGVIFITHQDVIEHVFIMKYLNLYKKEVFNMKNHVQLHKFK